MATDILIKRSTTSGAVPTTGDLSTGELAINTADKRLFTNNSGTIVEIGTAPTSLAVTNNATVGGTLDITGDTTVATGTATNWTVSGTLTVATPSNSTDAASKGYVDTADALKVAKAGDTMSGDLAMGTNKVTGLGTPTASTDAATKGYVDAQVTAVIDSAPGALDTLNELAAAINDDANFATTVTNALAGKLALAGGTMTGDITLGANKATSTATPATDDTLTRKGYVDTQDATKLNLSGGTMTGDITLGANKATSTATPTTDDTLTRKGYVDSILGSATDAATSATAAASSATDAANSASAASTSATNAATSASNASTSETNAATSASSASSSATASANSATAAATSASNAATSEANAAASYDSFDDRYLGAKASDPSVDNDGDALIEGALYFNSTTDEMRVYTGSAWANVRDLTGSVDINGGTIDGVTIGGASAGAGTFTNLTATGTTTLAGASTSADITFGDNDKAIFGAGSDLQIYHDGSNSIIADEGAGDLIIQAGNDLILRATDGISEYLRANEGLGVQLYYNGDQKFLTTSTGIDVTGTVTADRLDIDYGVANSAAAVIDHTDTANGTGVLITAGGSNSGKYVLWGRDGSGNSRFYASANGDISFYEDTGTTPKLFWDASAESLGIGTSSPNNQLEIKSDTATVVARLACNAGSGRDYGLASNTTGDFGVFDYDSNLYRLYIDSSGNVGIGTTSPERDLHVKGTSGNPVHFKLEGDPADYARIMFDDGTTDNIGEIRYNFGSDFMSFNTNNSERMRIDSSGNLLVGTTDVNPYDNTTGAGIALRSTGAIYNAIDGGTALILNRMTSDGAIAQFRKDGSTVGSIGARAGTLFIQGTESTTAGLKMSNGAVRPCGADGSNSDNDTDLGTSGTRFKDLYLSGGVYLGGTGSANKLDDYEEGTFDITITPETSGSITVTTGFNSLIYTKIGRIVHITGGIGLSGVSSPVGTFITIAGLPFTLPSLPENQEQVGFALYYRDDSTGARSLLPCSYVSGTSFIAEITAANIQANDAFQFDFSYVTS